MLEKSSKHVLLDPGGALSPLPQTPSLKCCRNLVQRSARSKRALRHLNSIETESGTMEVHCDPACLLAVYLLSTCCSLAVHLLFTSVEKALERQQLLCYFILP